MSKVAPEGQMSKQQERELHQLHSVEQRIAWNDKCKKYYDYFMIITIIGNSICLALTDYSDDNNVTEWNQKLNLIDQVFTVYYIIEACLKIIGFGFIMHKLSYLRDRWNIIDFIVVVIGVISLIPNFPNLKSLRIMRLLRPLRTINAVPSMKRLVKTLLMSLPQMGYLVTFLLFFITVFAILGNQLLARDLYYRCRLTEEPFQDINGTWSWPLDQSQQRSCGGYYQCNNGTYCHALIEKQIPLDVDNIYEWDSIQYGYFQFDNIGAGILAIFRVITLEGWTAYMYNYLDSSGFVATLYFPILVVLGSFFFLNLFLAVITDTFSENSQKQLTTEEAEEAQKRKIEEDAEKKAKAKAAALKKIYEQNMKQASKGKGSIVDIIRLEKEKQELEELEKQAQEQKMIRLQNDQSEHYNEGLVAGVGEETSIINKKEASIVATHNNLSQPGESNNFNSKIQQFFHTVCMSISFQVFINFCIVFNTLCLGLDYYPSNPELQTVLDKLNIVFFAIFFLEMVLKIIGLGPNIFIKDQYNIFDAVIGKIFKLNNIVILSIIDVSINFSISDNSNDESKNGKGAISAFRAFRLMRVFKLAKSWTELNKLILTIAKSLQDISSFSVLLFLLMFIYVLLGMQIFAENFDPNSTIIQPRTNFKNFFKGFVLVFTVLTGENWDMTMFQFAKSHGYVAIVYFITLVIIGVMIFLNLFLAILLENFEQGDNEEIKQNQSSAEQSENQTQPNWIQTTFIAVLGRTIKCMKKEEQSKEEINPNSVNKEGTGTINTAGNNQSPKKEQKIIRIGALDQEKTIQNIVALEDSIIHGVDKNASHYNLIQMPENLRDAFQAESENDNTTNNNMIYQQNIALGGTTLKKPTGLIAIKEFSILQTPDRKLFENPILTGRAMIAAGSIAEFQETPNNLNMMATVADGYGGYQTIDLKNLKSNRSVDYDQLDENNEQIRKINNEDFMNTKSNLLKLHKSDGLDVSVEGKSSSDQIGSKSNPQSYHGQNSMVGKSINGGSPSGKTNSKSIALLMLQKGIEKQLAQQIEAQSLQTKCEGNSLIIFGSDNAFRKLIARLVKSQKFDMFILLLIAISSILIALDNPLNDPHSTLTSFLLYSDFILTSFFLAESMLKIVSSGFLFNGEVSYMRNGWNAIDFIVVIISIVSLVVSSNKFKIVKIFRLLRILRPLRVISKNKGLKIGIQSLFSAIPKLFNVTIISLLFFIICGIIGITYFKGTFFTCYFGPGFPDYLNLETQLYVTTKFDCLNLGGAWINADQHFDNLAEAISTLFQISTTEGWIDVMNRGIDSVGIDMQPIVENNVYWALFFMVFIFFGNFLILNLFTGVVCDTYNNEKEILGKSYLLSNDQKLWLDYKKQCMNLTPKFKVHEDQIGGLRHLVYRFTTSRRFEFFILVCIICNTITLCINWYSQKVSVDDQLDYINYGFASVFAIEALLKIYSLGFKDYFREGGNVFDFSIVCFSIVTSIVSLTMKVDFGASSNFIRALKINKIFRFVQQPKQIKVIFETLVVTIPALTNIGGLLILLLYMFSVLGVFLFADIKLQSNLDVHANFQSFGFAFLTLLRCSTGEAWNSIMTDTMRQRSIVFQCRESEFNYDSYIANGMQTDGCGNGPAGIIFFFAYFLLVPLFFLDLFVAIILQGFEQMSKKVENLIQEEHFENFRDCWLEFDPDGTGFMKTCDFAQFMVKLGKPLGWTEDYRIDFVKQDLFLEELNIPTYNEFADFLFYDVIQGLVKVYLVNHEMRKRAAGKGPEDSFHTDMSLSIGEQEEVNDDINDQLSQSITHKREKIKQTYYIDSEEKINYRLEFEFESLDDDKQDVMDVEEIQAKERRVLKAYIAKRDQSFTSAHFKAARKILNGLKRLRNQKKTKEIAGIYGVDTSFFSQYHRSASISSGGNFSSEDHSLRRSKTKITKKKLLDPLDPIQEEDKNNSTLIIQIPSLKRGNEGKSQSSSPSEGLMADVEADAISGVLEDFEISPPKISTTAAEAIASSRDHQSNNMIRAKQAWGENSQNSLKIDRQDVENKSSMGLKPPTDDNVQVKNPLRRGGTTVAEKTTKTAAEDSASYIKSGNSGKVGGLTGDGSGSAIIQAQAQSNGIWRQENQTISNNQQHQPEMFYRERDSSSSLH